MNGYEERRGVHGSYTVRLDHISKGGVGSIHLTSDPRFVYKKYFVSDKAPEASHLERLVDIGRRVLIEDQKKPGDTPESSVNWPVDFERDMQGRLLGTVLPLIPPELFNQHGGVNTLDFLIMKRANPPEAVGRVVLLLRMAEILRFIDNRGLIHGDINSKNLAWTLDPHPIMYLIDCDGMIPQDPPPLTGVGAAGWTDPRVQDRLIPAHDHYSDRYALSLAMYRGLLLTPGNLDRDMNGWKKPSAIPQTMDPRIATLLRRGLSDPLNHLDRPSPAEWVQEIQSVYLPDGQFNHAALRELPSPTVQTSSAHTFIPIPNMPLPQPPPPQPRLPPPPPSVVPVPQPPQPRLPPPPPSGSPGSHPAAPQTGYARGQAGFRALEGRVSWYVMGVLAFLFIPPLCLIYSIVSLAQLRGVNSRVRGLRRAQIGLWIFTGLSALRIFGLLFGST